MEDQALRSVNLDQDQAPPRSRSKSMKRTFAGSAIGQGSERSGPGRMEDFDNWKPTPGPHRRVDKLKRSH